MIIKHNFLSGPSAVTFLQDVGFPYTQEMESLMLLEMKGIPDHAVIIEMETVEVESRLPLKNKTFKDVVIKYRHMIDWGEKEVSPGTFTLENFDVGKSNGTWTGWGCWSTVKFSDVHIYSNSLKPRLNELIAVIQVALEGPFSSEDPPRPVPAHTEYEADTFAGKFKTFKLGDVVTKTKGSQWTGKVVGFYSTALTPEGYAVESSTERGSVQIYPASALTLLQL